MLSFRKKLMSQSRENLWTDGRMDGRTEGRTDTLFHGTLLAEARGPISLFFKLCASVKRTFIMQAQRDFIDLRVR